MKPKIDYVKQGRLNKAAGARFELKVRKDLESKKWIVCRWSNNVEFPGVLFYNNSIEFQKKGKLIPAKPGRFKMLTTGFPDFLIFKGVKLKEDHSSWTVGEFCGPCKLYENIGIECKSRGYLDKEEKEKCKWYLKNNIFSKIFIAAKDKKNRGGIIYKEFK